ncbi:MAG TPA: hypothetical protein VF592_13400 [Sphingomonas sp.]|jgi:uncharacterized membrane protein (UPF0136 family)|uniref:hypothetical protein n=1 Tax=Sphingomonas sp. TaxID=28214 RepID=UPI002EDB5A83
MARSRPSAAGGVLIAIGAIVGTAVGVARQQPTLGLIIGIATGAALAVAIWLRDRAR